MTALWIAAASLALLALFFVIPPLLSGGARARAVSRRGVNLAVLQDQLRELDRELATGGISEEQHRQAKQEIEVRVVEDVPDEVETGTSVRRPLWLVGVLGVMVPAASLGLYSLLGNPAAVDVAAVAPTAHDGGHAMSPEQIEARLDALKARLRAKPDDAAGWVMLARTQSFLGRHADAADSLKKATELVPDNPDLLADYADMLAMARGKRLAGEPEALVKRALEVDPTHIKSLALAGTAAFERADYRTAADLWERALKAFPPGAEGMESIQAAIADAREKGGISGPMPTPVAAAAGASITGKVTLSPELAARVRPTDTLFVFARAASGPPMPLVILRRAAGDLPLEFRLDDSMAMQPDRRLADFPKLVVAARISRSGQAESGPDDLVGQSGPVAPGSDVSIVIDRVGPR